MSIFLSLLILASIIGVAAVIGKRSLIFKYPFAACVLVALWFTPQFIAVNQNTNLDFVGIELYGLMSILCLSAIFAGWYYPPFKIKRLRLRSKNYTPGLTYTAIALSLFGAAFNLALRDVPEELRSVGQWSGNLTIYLTFAKVQILAMAILWIIYLKSGSKLALAFAIANLLFFAEMIFIGARRGIAANVALVILLGLWFVRQKQPYRFLIIFGLMGATFFLNTVTEIRSATNGRALFGSEMTPSEYFDAVANVNYVGKIVDTEKPVQSYEIVNGFYIVSATNETLSFSGISDFWNILVLRYIPGQLIGEKNKQSMLMNVEDTALSIYNHQRYRGTTVTGFADSFRAFWFLGAFLFFYASAFLRGVYERAMGGDTWAQFLYPFLLTDGLLAISHSSAWFIRELPFYLAFGGIAFWAARAMSQARHGTSLRRNDESAILRAKFRK